MSLRLVAAVVAVVAGKIFLGSHAHLVAEDIVELGTRRKSASGGDCVVAVFGVFEQQFLGG